MDFRIECLRSFRTAPASLPTRSAAPGRESRRILLESEGVHAAAKPRRANH